ncbi:Transcription factor [Coemansia sp. RSA 1200]|nr:Transcription factor [Coemansia sp. RSA 1200]
MDSINPTLPEVSAPGIADSPANHPLFSLDSPDQQQPEEAENRKTQQSGSTKSKGKNKSEEGKGTTAAAAAAAAAAAIIRASKAAKKKGELLTEEEKKANHIASEQKRRQNIRVGYDQLIQIVPTLTPSQRSEALILQKTVEYIKYLLMEREILDGQLKDVDTN